MTGSWGELEGWIETPTAEYTCEVCTCHRCESGGVRIDLLHRSKRSCEDDATVADPMPVLKRVERQKDRWRRIE